MLNRSIVERIVATYEREATLVNEVPTDVGLINFLQLNGYIDESEIVKDFVEHIEVGDLVKVVDWGKEYSTLPEWVVNNVKDPMLVALYAYDDTSKYETYNSEADDDNYYKVLATDNEHSKFYIIDDNACWGGVDGTNYHGKCFVVGGLGLTKVEE